MEEETITLPTVTKDEVKKTIVELVDTNRILNDDKCLAIIAIKKKNFDLMDSLNPIIHQVCDCLLVDANIAAITLTNFLIERVLKLGVIMREGNGKSYNFNESLDQLFKHEIDNYDDKNMEQTINKSKSLGLITKEEAKELKGIKEKYRNPFSHASHKEILVGATTTITKLSSSNPNEIKEETVDISTFPLLQGFGLSEYCKKHAFNYLVETFVYACKIEERLKRLYQ